MCACVCVRARVCEEWRRGRRERETDLLIKFGELAYMIVEGQVENLQSGQAGWRPREELQPKGSRLAEFLLPPWAGRSGFVILKPSLDWMRPTHIREGTQSLLI